MVKVNRAIPPQTCSDPRAFVGHSRGGYPVHDLISLLRRTIVEVVGQMPGKTPLLCRRYALELMPNGRPHLVRKEFAKIPARQTITPLDPGEEIQAGQGSRNPFARCPGPDCVHAQCLARLDHRFPQVPGSIAMSAHMQSQCLLERARIDPVAEKRLREFDDRSRLGAPTLSIGLGSGF